MERPLVIERVRTASHILAWVIIIPITIWILWSALSKKTESTDYSKGATHNEATMETTVHEYPLSFGCARFDLRDMAVKPKKVKEK